METFTVSRVVICLICFALAALPGAVRAAGTWTPEVEIESAYAHGGHGGYGIYKISDTTVNPGGCNATWYVVSKQNNAMFEEIYALLLAAHLANKKVLLFVDGCSPHNHPLIIHARTAE